MGIFLEKMKKCFRLRHFFSLARQIYEIFFFKLKQTWVDFEMRS